MEIDKDDDDVNIEPFSHENITSTTHEVDDDHDYYEGTHEDPHHGEEPHTHWW